MIQVQAPFPLFFDKTGGPIDNGSVYIGEAGSNPQTNPIQVSWDVAGLIAAAQPLKISGGMVVRYSTPSRTFIDADDYSMSVYDKNGVLVWSTLSAKDPAAIAQSALDAAVASASASKDAAESAAEEAQTLVDGLDSTIADLPFGGGRNLCINGGFNTNLRDVSGTVSLSPGEFGHSRWYAGTGGCTYTFNQSAGITTITISSGTLKQIINATAIIDGDYILSWQGSANGRIGTTSYGASSQTGNLSGGVTTTIEFSTGTISRVMFERGTTVHAFEPINPTIERKLCEFYYKRRNITHRFDGAWTVGASYIITDNIDSMAGTPTVEILSSTLTGFTSPSALTATASGGQFSLSVSAAGPVTRIAILELEYDAEAPNDESAEA